MKRYLLLLLLIANCALIQQASEIDYSKIKVSYDPGTSTDPAYTPILPDIPTGLTLIQGDTQIEISWQPSLNATSYNLYYQTTPGAFATGTLIQGVSSPYIHTGLVNGQTYYYQITAVNADGMSNPSSELSATAGVIDNHNGTVNIVHLAQIWPKCGQVNTAGVNAYNQLTDDCTGGTQGLFMQCNPDGWSCFDPVNPTYLNGLGVSEVWDTCFNLNASGFAGRVWRVPTTADLMAFQIVYKANQNIFSGIVSDKYWSSDAFPIVAVDLYDGFNAHPARTWPHPVVCVGN